MKGENGTDQEKHSSFVDLGSALQSEHFGMEDVGGVEGYGHGDLKQIVTGAWDRDARHMDAATIEGLGGRLRHKDVDVAAD